MGAPKKDQPGMLATGQADGIKALARYNFETGDVPYHEWTMHMEEFLKKFKGVKYDQNSPDGKLVTAVREVVDDQRRSDLGIKGQDIESLASDANRAGPAGKAVSALEAGFKGRI